MIRGLLKEEYDDLLLMEQQIKDQEERNRARWAYYTA